MLTSLQLILTEWRSRRKLPKTLLSTGLKQVLLEDLVDCESEEAGVADATTVLSIRWQHSERKSVVRWDEEQSQLRFLISRKPGTPPLHNALLQVCLTRSCTHRRCKMVNRILLLHDVREEMQGRKHWEAVKRKQVRTLSVCLHAMGQEITVWSG